MEKISNYLTILLKVTFVAGILVTIFLRNILEYKFMYYFVSDIRYYWGCIILISISGLCAVYIIFQLIKIMDTISNKNPFIKKNVDCLKKIAFTSFIISLCFAILMILRASIFTFAISYTFFIAGLSFLVFSGIIDKGITYKDENDLTV